MTSDTPTRTIKVEALTRVEGEGGLFVRLVGDRIEDVQLTIFEPPRLFEALLRGRKLEEVPDITARICGICPVAYQMSSVHALEAALGIEITDDIRRLRRLLYCGEWIESHTLHVHLLHAPDFLGYDSGIDMARDFPNEVNRGLRLKKHGNQLLEVLGGRAIHPVNVAVGGFYRVPRRDELAPLIPNFEWGLSAAVETTRWLASLEFPDFTRAYDMVSLVHPDEYPMNEGRVTSTTGSSWGVHDYETEFHEDHVAHSTALQSSRSGQRNVAASRQSAGGSEEAAHVLVNVTTSYHVGPLARVNLNRDRLSPIARRVADEIGFETPCLNPFRAIVARGLEIIHAYEEALDILRSYQPPKIGRVKYTPRAGEGCAATEAPRGLIYHRYQVDDAGLITLAKIVPPTSQNQRQIEDDLRDYLPRILTEDEAATARQCERLVRCYDPCISCSTHFLKLTVQRDG